MVIIINVSVYGQRPGIQGKSNSDRPECFRDMFGGKRQVKVHSPRLGRERVAYGQFP